MKGGVAAMVFALEALRVAGRAAGRGPARRDQHRRGVLGRRRHGARRSTACSADAGIVTEPTGFEVWVACRGSEYGVIRVPGRPGHAEVRQPDWRRGGAVNAIEKAAVVLDAIDVAARRVGHAAQGLDHPYLSRPSLLPTMARSGEWPVTYPAECELTIAVMYVPHRPTSAAGAPTSAPRSRRGSSRAVGRG